MRSPKIPPPIIGLICAGLIFLLARYNVGPHIFIPHALPVALSLAALGLFITLLSVRAFGKAKTTIHPLVPMKSKALVVTGVNRFSRNPMYLGMVFMLIAISIYAGSILAIAPLALFILYITQFQIKPEEAALRKLFGEDYAEYCAKVRRWL